MGVKYINKELHACNMLNEECVVLLGVYREISDSLDVREEFNKVLWRSDFRGRLLEGLRGHLVDQEV